MVSTFIIGRYMVGHSAKVVINQSAVCSRREKKNLKKNLTLIIPPQELKGCLEVGLGWPLLLWWRHATVHESMEEGKEEKKRRKEEKSSLVHKNVPFQGIFFCHCNP